MSDLESTDLICESRRRELSEREQRRLEELLSRDLGARLTQLMQPELERCSRVRPGDDLLSRRIVERALLGAGVQAAARSQTRVQHPYMAVRKRRGRGPLWLLAAAILFGATGAAAWWATHSQALSSPGEPSDESTQATGARHVIRIATPSRAPVAAPSIPARVLEPAADRDAEEPQLLPSSDASHTPAPEATAPSHGAARQRMSTVSAAQLFADANLLRREGRLTEAIRLYQRILTEAPNMREASLTRLVLAKSLAASNPKQALAYYQEVARVDGSLRAEALWGVVQTATQLKQVGVKRQAITELIREFPDSAYADVARQEKSDVAR